MTSGAAGSKEQEKGNVSPDDAITSANDLGVVGALVVVIIVLTGLIWFAFRSLNQKLGQVNRAVNNSPTGDPTMLDRVKRIESAVDRVEEWFDDFNRKGWTALPPDLGDAGKLTDTIRVIQHRMEELHGRDAQVEAKLDVVLRELREHVKWEMSAKYGVHGQD